MMEQQAIQLIKKELDTKRFEHSLRVMETAQKLAKRYEAPVEKVVLASLLHDYAKCRTREELRNNVKEYTLPNELLDYHHELWHGPVAAKEIKELYGITDETILNAIYYHTTGHPELELVEVIVFVADYIEPARNIPGVEMVRKLAEINIYDAARAAIKNTIIYLMQQNATIHPDSFSAYNEWTKKQKEEIDFGIIRNSCRSL